MYLLRICLYLANKVILLLLLLSSDYRILAPLPRTFVGATDYYI